MTNRLGDWLKDIRNPETSAQRVTEIERQANEFFDKASKAVSWTRPTDNSPTFDRIRAREGEFEVSPIDGMLAFRTSVQSIPDNAITDIQFGRHTGDNNTFRMLSTTKVGVSTKHYLIGVFGTAQWATDGNGRRGVGIAVYNSSDVQVYGFTLQSLLPTGIAVDTLPFAGGITIYDHLDVSYFKVNVVQTSGGALDMQYFRAFFFVMK